MTPARKQRLSPSASHAWNRTQHNGVLVLVLYSIITGRHTLSAKRNLRLYRGRAALSSLEGVGASSQEMHTKPNNMQRDVRAQMSDLLSTRGVDNSAMEPLEPGWRYSWLQARLFIALLRTQHTEQDRVDEAEMRGWRHEVKCRRHGRAKSRPPSQRTQSTSQSQGSQQEAVEVRGL